MTREEKAKERKLNRDKIVKLATAILIDGYSINNTNITTTSAPTNKGVWMYHKNLNNGYGHINCSCVYDTAYICIKPSRSSVTNYLSVAYIPRVVSVSNNEVPIEAVQESMKYSDGRIVKKGHQVAMEKLVNSFNSTLPTILENVPLVLKMSRRPTQDEIEWAHAVIESEGGGTIESGSYNVSLSYPAIATESIFIERAASKLDAHNKAVELLKATKDNRYVSASITPGAEISVNNSQQSVSNSNTNGVPTEFKKNGVQIKL